jgi:hypothetical protein
VFVADEVPPELRRVVEFLNGQMDPAEVLAVEVKQYVNDGLFQALLERSGPQEVKAARSILEWARTAGRRARRAHPGGRLVR